MSTPAEMPSQDQRPAEMLSVSQALTLWLRDAVKTWTCLIFLSYVGMVSCLPLLEFFKASDKAQGDTDGSHPLPKFYVVCAVCTITSLLIAFPVWEYKRVREMPLMASAYHVVGKTVGTSVVFFLAGLTVYFPENTLEAIIFVSCTSLFLFSLIALFHPTTDFGLLYFCLAQCIIRSCKLWSFGIYTILMYIVCVFIVLLRNILEDPVPIPVITHQILDDERTPLLPIQQLPRTTHDATTSTPPPITAVEDPKNKESTDSTEEVLPSKNGKGVSTHQDSTSTPPPITAVEDPKNKESTDSTEEVLPSKNGEGVSTQQD